MTKIHSPFFRALIFGGLLGGLASCGGGSSEPGLVAPPAPVVTVAVAPAAAAMPAGLGQAFGASVSGTASGTVTWSVIEGASGGTVNSAGFYTSPAAPGTFHVRASADASHYADATVTVTPAISVSLSPAAMSLAPGAAQAFIAEVRNGTGTAVGWSATGGAITATGLFTAGPALGTATVRATSQQDPTKSAEAVITIAAVPQLPAITSFTAAPATITPGQSTTLAWVVVDATSLSIAANVGPNLGSVSGASRAVSPTVTTTYTMSASNAVGTVTATATVTVATAPQAPVISSFAASPATINRGQSATLAWTVDGATALALDQTIGTVTGTTRSVAPTATTTYQLSATNSAGATTATATVTVLQPPTITSFTATPGTITAGQSTTLAWVVNGATGLSLNQGIGAVAGSSRLVSPAVTTSYLLTATNAVASVIANATVTVAAVAPPVISSFTAAPASIPAGTSAVLTWTVSGATALSLNQGIGTVIGTSRSVTPAATTSYVLTATNAGGATTATATVTVTAPSPTANPILFVTQVPFDGFATISMPFANHDGSVDSVPRGGDLWIRYPDGTLRNLTQEAGFGMTGLQGANSIAVREPSMHWSAAKAVFAMVVGTGTQQYVWLTHYWQLYEVSGLGKGQPAVITKIPNQPNDTNNISPVYGTDERIIFASDRSRSGERHLYPQLDEYESTVTLSGLWSLDPSNGDLKLLNHTPSGAFHPFVDSFGRVVFTKWDHLQRDQQADADNTGGTNGSFNYADETVAAGRSASRAEVFPEPRADADPENIANHANGHRFNEFFPWQLNEDGTEEETLNHVGRHEIGGNYLEEPAFTDDPNLSAYAPESFHSNRNYLNGDGGIFSLREDPRRPGLFFATNMREFNGGRAGQIITLNGAVGTSPEAMNITWITDPATKNEVQPGDPTPSGATGRYRNPLPMSDGTLIAAHTPEVMSDANLGTRANPNYRYQFRLKSLKQTGATYVADQLLTPGFTKSVSWYDPDVLVSYNGPLWEVDPVEVVARVKPARRSSALQAPEQQVFSEVGVDETALRTWLRSNNLALIVSRDVTTRDRADVQQPFNLRVPGGASTVPLSGKVYDLAHLQIFQGDQIRGYGGTATPRAGRRVLSQTMHGSAVTNNPANPGGPAGSVKVGLDGSTAAFVPAQRALTWQLTDGVGKAVVRERNWISFQPGEIRTCVSCHGINSHSQTGAVAPQNKPEALRQLLAAWKLTH